MSAALFAPKVSRSVAVVGSGFVGASCALHLQRAGYAVTLLDKHKAGSPSQASYGNAGTFAKYANIPINKPGILWDVPGMLANPDGPLSLAMCAHLPTMGPWGCRFLAASRKGRVGQVSQSLSNLLGDAESGWHTAFEQADIDIDRHRVKNGCLYLFGTESGWEAARRETATRRLSCNVAELSPNEIAQLEPALASCYVGGLHFESWHLLNPGSLVAGLVDGFESRGGRIIQQNVESILPGHGVVLDSGEFFAAQEVVVAAGAHSKTLAASVGDKIPLDTERGYSIFFSGHSHHVSRPVGWADSGFYMTPMADGLRIAGTVELGGLKAPMSPGRCDMLERSARKLLPGLPSRSPEKDWLGFRPTLPDSLPVIGRSLVAPGVTYAFGHQHIGFTLGGVTGKLVAEMVAGHTPSVDVHPYRPQRFSEYIAGESFRQTSPRSRPTV